MVVEWILRKELIYTLVRIRFFAIIVLFYHTDEVEMKKVSKYARIKRRNKQPVNPMIKAVIRQQDEFDKHIDMAMKIENPAIAEWDAVRDKLNTPERMMERMQYINKRREELRKPGQWPYLGAEMKHVHVTGLNPEALFIHLPMYPEKLWFNLTNGECFVEYELHQCEYYVGCYMLNDGNFLTAIAEVTQTKRPPKE